MYFSAAFQKSFPEICAGDSGPPHRAVTDLPELSLPCAGWDISTASKACCAAYLYSTATPVLLHSAAAVSCEWFPCADLFTSIVLFYLSTNIRFINRSIYRRPCPCLSTALPDLQQSSRSHRRQNECPPPPNCCFSLSFFYLWQCCFSSYWCLILHEMLEKSIFFLI